jgi:LuxR family maltose regulon positive regulatory protein
VDAARRALEEAARAGQQAGNVMVAVMALCALAELCAALTQLPRAAELYRQALDLAAGERGQPLPIAGMALIGLGELSREWNDLEAAARTLEDGIERVKQWGELGAIDGYLALARVRQASGDPAGARAAMATVRQLTARSGAAQLADPILTTYQARLWIAQGDLAAARQLLEARGAAGALTADLLPGSGAPSLSFDYHVHKHERLVWARLWIALGDPAQALALIEPFLAAVEQLGGQRTGRAVELRILRALALQGLGETDQALEALALALSIAEPGGYIRLFLDEGEPMAHLLREAAAHGIAPAYVRKLLSAWDGEPSGQAPVSAVPQEAAAHPPSPTIHPPSPAVPRPPSPLVEPLTDREREVLGLLATHLNSTEIAGQLCISTHTARYHIKNIYGKLGVHRRTEAVERARELGLL